jgi:hypothetical protein
MEENIVMEINSGRKNPQDTAVSTGQPHTKGEFWRKYDIVNSIFATYFISPKNQVRRLCGHLPYKGKRDVDLKINVELIGTYGRRGKNPKYHFLLTILILKEKSYEYRRHYYGYRSIC